jgi:hypothetical protein
MKLDKTKLDRVLKSPDNIGALLFYGPDEGLAHEYAGLAQKAVLGVGDDPFRLAELTPTTQGRRRGWLMSSTPFPCWADGACAHRPGQQHDRRLVETAIAGQVPGSACWWSKPATSAARPNW